MLGSHSNQVHSVVDALLFIFIPLNLSVVCTHTYTHIYLCGCTKSGEILGKHAFKYELYCFILPRRNDVVKYLFWQSYRMTCF